MRILLALLLLLTLGHPAAARNGFVFASIDGGEIALDDFTGRPVLVVNSASLCGFTPQYEGLQALYDSYRDRGLVVLAVPSNDFRQELGSAEEVKDFCATTFDLDLPMAEITHVRGDQAHPFYQWVAETTGFVPGWNFNKVLIGTDGTVVEAWGSLTRPQARAITRAIEAQLAP
ncbi:glutathione peroxidase [Rhodovulum sp. NI22]|nr:glutathione peroxidase [Rhodovulum sp. NI22]